MCLDNKPVNRKVAKTGNSAYNCLRYCVDGVGVKTAEKIVNTCKLETILDVVELSVDDIVDIKALCNIDGDVKILLSVNENEKNLKKVLKENPKYDTIIIVVGPEGGFTEKEEDELIKNGYIRTSLGERVLRTETAGMVSLAMINYEWMV